MRSIEDVAGDLNFAPTELQSWGPGVAKISPEVVFRQDPLIGKLVLVSAISPTPAGEGKTTCTIGLTQAARRIGPGPGARRAGPRSRLCTARAVARPGIRCEGRRHRRRQIAPAAVRKN